MSDPNVRHYRYIRAWCRMMSSSEEYAHRQVELARRENAPADAIYRTTDGKWRRFIDITREDTRDLVKKIMAEMEGHGT